MNQGVKFPQVVAVHNAEPDEVTPTFDSQLFADPSLVIFNAFGLNNQACSYFGGSQAICDERQNVPFAVCELEQFLVDRLVIVCQ
jgi:hypothetical protein